MAAQVPPRPHDPAPAAFDLLLYVAGENPTSTRAIENLRRICDEHLAGRHRIEIIDLLEHPDLARERDIIAVPTLVRRRPRPVRTMIGDLSDATRVLACLELRAPDDAGSMTSPAPAGAPDDAGSMTSPAPAPGPSSSPRVPPPRTPGDVVHHRVDLPPHLGHPTRLGGAILLAGAAATAFWGVVLGNVLRGADLVHRPLTEFFTLSNGFAVGGGSAGAFLFLISAEAVVIRQRSAPRDKQPDEAADLAG